MPGVENIRACLKVSVIIPVYNTEAYVGETILSILNQDLKEIEIIVINDGSSDGSAAVIEKLVKQDNRIQFLSQQNSGQSVARNRGLEQARGKYIYFMDSDDLLDSDALQLCYEKCVSEDLDYVFFDGESFGYEGKAESWFDYKRTQFFEDKVYQGIELLPQMLALKCYKASVCLNLYKRDFLVGNSLNFYPGILHEDELFSARCYVCAKRIGLIDRAFFKRRLRPGSVMTSKVSIRNIENYFVVLAELKKIGAISSLGERQVIDRLVEYIINPVLEKAWELRWWSRVKVAGISMMKYLSFISFRSVAILLFKLPLKKCFN